MTGDAVDQARRLARERLLDDKRVLRATDTSVARNVMAECGSKRVSTEMYPPENWIGCYPKCARGYHGGSRR